MIPKPSPAASPARPQQLTDSQTHQLMNSPTFNSQRYAENSRGVEKLDSGAFRPANNQFPTT